MYFERVFRVFWQSYTIYKYLNSGPLLAHPKELQGGGHGAPSPLVSAPVLYIQGPPAYMMGKKVYTFLLRIDTRLFCLYTLHYRLR